VKFSENKKTLLNLLADGEFHSGTELAEFLNISRSGVWKIINALEEGGVEIIAVTGKGYCLKQALELLDRKKIDNFLSDDSKAVISTLELHDQIGSTSQHLNDIAYAEPQRTGVFCITEQQTAGKGRRGRQWVSPFGSNLYFSLLWRFDEGPASLTGLSLVIGIAVIRALNSLGIDGVGLKWPNDIYYQQKKLGGILVEVSGESSGPCNAVIGLGLNLHVTKDEAISIEQDWIDIKQILVDNQSISRNQLLACLINEMLLVTKDYTQKTFSEYTDEWRSYDCMRGKQVDVFIGKQTISGSVQGIDDNGLLLLEDNTGKVARYASGEVSFSKA